MAMTVNELCAEVTLFCNLDTSAHNYSANELFHHVLSAVHRLYLRIAECEHVNVSREEILEAIRPVRDILSRSTFLKRLQTWPRGYSGDFETIEYLCSGSAVPLPGTIHDVCEHYALVCSAAQQHRNKVKQQAALIVDTVMASSAMRILSIACGGAPDLALAVPAVKDRQFQCVLNDMDGEALAFAQQRNSAIQQKLSVHQGDVIRLLRRTADLGRFDLVLAGGLFDYLSDRQIVFILRTIYQSVLAPGGSLFFTNISNMNPYRIWMTYFVNWQLIERSPDDIRRLVADAGIPPDCVSVERDQTGLALLSTVKKSL